MSSSLYEKLLTMLKVLDKESLIQMFHDIEDIDVIRNIWGAASIFVDNNLMDLPEPIIKKGEGIVAIYSTVYMPNTLKDDEEFKEYESNEYQKELEQRDYQQRYRDHKND
jgi:hypothetical protein